MLLSVIAIRFPYVGGGILIAAGIIFAIWWLIPMIKSGFYSLSITMERIFLSGGGTSWYPIYPGWAIQSKGQKARTIMDFSKCKIDRRNRCTFPCGINCSRDQPVGRTHPP